MLPGVGKRTLPLPSSRPCKAIFSLCAACFLLAPLSSRADDWAVALGRVEIREQPGFSQDVLEKSPVLSLYKVLTTLEAKGEGSQQWYEIVLREDRQVRKSQAKGWVLQLAGEPDPLLKTEVPIYKTPDTSRLLGTRKSRLLQPTGLKSPDGHWHEVSFEERIENVQNQVGYIPASLAAFFHDPDLTELVPRIERIRTQPWPVEWKANCVRGTIRKGFPRLAVQLALGEAGQISSVATARADETWSYSRGKERVQIFFRDGKVVGWKSQKAR